MAKITIPVGEIGTTRVFSLSMNTADAQRLRDNPAIQATMMGAEPLNPDGIEVFALSDLGDLGLAGFLRDGVDAHPDDLRRDQAKLSALDGWVLLIHSTAFATTGATLIPAAALTLIGTYAQTPADQTQTTLRAQTAKPYTGAQPDKTTKLAGAGRRGSSVVIAVALVAFGLLWWALT